MSPIDGAYSSATNKEIIASWREHPWYLAIAQCHEEMREVDPGYRIVQIKEKFGGLRYYYDPSHISDTYIADLLDQEVRVAEAWVDGFERGRKHEQP